MKISKVYDAPPTVGRMMLDDSFFRAIMGPLGCVDASTEFLTPTGWKRIDSYTGGDLVAQYDRETGGMSFVEPLEYIKEPCNDMLHFKTKYGVDQMLSPEHRVLYRTRKGAVHVKSALEVAAHHWESKAGFEGKFYTTFKAQGGDGLDLSDEDLRLQVAVLADGSFENPHTGYCRVNLKKVRKKQRLERLLEAAGRTFKTGSGYEGFTVYYFHAPMVAKNYDTRFWSCTDAQLAIIADEVRYWDSHISVSGGVKYSTLSKQDADFVQYAFAATGTRAYLAEYDRLEDKGFIEYAVITTVSTNMVSVGGSSSDGVRRHNITWAPSPDGFKYCFSVPSTFLILRRNGCVFVTGNSGKSVGCCMEIFKRCMEMTPGPDGIRRSRWVVVRNTNQQLKDTTLKTWMDWFPPGAAGTWVSSDACYKLKVKDVEAEILFRPLDTPQDAARVLSLELTGAWLNEAREIPREIVEALQGRVGRYPSKANVDSYWHGMIADTNPPEIDSYWYKVFEGLPIDGDDEDTIVPCTSFIQPSGLSPTAENREHLPNDYYERQAKGRSKIWIDTHIKGQYSPSMSGKPVYINAFKQDRHIVNRVPIYGDLPVVVGMDFGRTPAAVFKQVDPEGRVITIAEACGFDMGIETFVRRLMKPTMRRMFPGNHFVIVGDPSGVRRNDTDESNCFSVLRDIFPDADVMAGRTNDPIIRIEATEVLLRDFPDGEPATVYDRIHCKLLIEGLRSKYRYKRKQGGGDEYTDKPEKNKWSHVVEANQYADDFINNGFDNSWYMNRGSDFEDDSDCRRIADSYTGY